MSAKIIGISGSPIKNSNTDRLIKTMLEASGLEYEFVKLSTKNIRPCYGCKRCVSDNICKINDDFPVLAEKLKKADAIVIGAYTPFNLLDSFTQSLFERFWSFSHKHPQLEGKKCATILSSINPQALSTINQYFSHKLHNRMLMDLVGQVSITGNVPCYSCTEIDQCASGTKNRSRFPDKTYNRVEDQDDIVAQAQRIGKTLGGITQ